MYEFLIKITLKFGTKAINEYANFDKRMATRIFLWYLNYNLLDSSPVIKPNKIKPSPIKLIKLSH